MLFTPAVTMWVSVWVCVCVCACLSPRLAVPAVTCVLSVLLGELLGGWITASVSFAPALVRCMLLPHALAGVLSGFTQCLGLQSDRESAQLDCNLVVLTHKPVVGCTRRRAHVPPPPPSLP